MAGRSSLRWILVLDIAALLALGLIPALAIAALLALRQVDRQVTLRQANPIQIITRDDFDHAHSVFNGARACGSEAPGATRPCPPKASGADAGQRPAVGTK
ncbi:hypothetical protein [Phreatobacter stygius]|uniref:Uncharacterized protein n=1 Tax=Phreatobacter stygius TaxID=1940610 RepID=A0A4D7AT19_9HYPH|nr:hypothetical protein [Phreatobacter stygius]QCI64089.1 hypothetical protein E8M01_07425 [Phreatobacter stygius]